MKKKKLILHIINSLGMGGTEKNLFQIIKKTNNKYNHIVISLTIEDFYTFKLKEIGVRVITINFKNKILLAFNFLKIIQNIYIIKPDVIQTWLYVSDLIGGLIGKFLGINNIIWGIRHDIKKNSPISEKIIVKVLSFLSYFIPNKIVSCSGLVAKNYIKYGYNKNKIITINNGVDIDKFKPNILAKKSLRKKYKISDDQVTISMIARFAKVKNHNLLFKSLALIKNKINFKCILMGNNINYKNKKLINLINSYKLKDKIILIENFEEIYEIFSLIDLNILTSHSECFPNVIAEAMSCGTPCISTKVGEAENIISNCGWIINDYSSETLSEKILEILKYGKKDLQIKADICRSRIINNYSMEIMIDSYKRLYSEYKTQL